MLAPGIFAPPIFPERVPQLPLAPPSPLQRSPFRLPLAIRPAGRSLRKVPAWSRSCVPNPRRTAKHLSSGPDQVPSDRLISGTTVGLPDGRGALTLTPASLNNCSIGSRRWACAIFKQAQLQMKPLFLPVAEFAVGAQHDLQMPSQILFGEQFRNSSHTLSLVA